MNWKKIGDTIVGGSIIMLLILGIVFPLVVFGGGIMTIFGFEYVSISSIFLFFTAVGVIGFPLEMLIKVICELLVSREILKEKWVKILFVVLDATGTYITMVLVDYIMKGVSATNLSMMVIALVMGVLSLNTKEKKKNV